MVRKFLNCIRTIFYLHLKIQTRRRMKLRKRQPFFLNYNKKTALTAAIVISFILAFVMLSSSIYAISLDKTMGIKAADLISVKSIATLLFNTLLLYFLFRLQFWAITHFPASRYKIWLILIGLLVIIAILSPFFSRMQWWWFREEVSPKAYSTIHYVKDLTVLIISFLFTALIYLINENQKNMTENQNLVIENLQNRYNALKNQTDPHFLFNSLNTLNGLIGYDDERAREYVEQLSAVFRYTMQDRSVIKVSEELQFVESYIYLMKIRYNDGLNVHIQHAGLYQECYILPFGLQILIENAIKHNVISRKDPLCILIEATENNTLRVENNRQPKQGEKNTTGLGLANLNERYRLMFGKEIEIYSDDKVFAVEIPLIKNREIPDSVKQEIRTYDRTNSAVI
ncbi:MAG TPA: histidine kinase [Porphyromonadaceae bacterium]|nr:histidine kinase [Porphyromonadaceae bacterium]